MGYESERLVLRERPGAQVAGRLAAAAEWTLLADNAGAPYARHTTELNWGVRRGIYVHLFHDCLSEYGALVVLADDVVEGREFERLLREHVQPLADHELLEPFGALPDPSDRMLRLMRLALGTPTAYAVDFHTRLEEAAGDSDPRVRDAVTLALGYVGWPELDPILQRLADDDPHPEVRADAADSLRLRTSGARGTFG